MTNQTPRSSPGKWAKPGDRILCVTSEGHDYYVPGKVYVMGEAERFAGEGRYDFCSGAHGTFIFADADAAAHAVKIHDLQQAVTDLQARVDAAEQNIARLERIKADDLVAQYGSNATTDPYAAGYWIPHTGDECPVPEGRREEVCIAGEIRDDPTAVKAVVWGWPRTAGITHWRYANPAAAKVAYEEWAAGHDGHQSDCAKHNEPAHPNGPCSCDPLPKPDWNRWRDHDGSDKCPVPVKHFREMVERDEGDFGGKRLAADVIWYPVKRWRYVNPKPVKGKWVRGTPAWPEQDHKMVNGVWYVRP
jgi:hypothetical protein